METESFKSEYDLVKAVKRILKGEKNNPASFCVGLIYPQHIKKYILKFQLKGKGVSD